MNRYEHYYVWIDTYDKLELLKDIVKLFSNVEIVDIGEVGDEELEIYEHGWHVRIKVDVIMGGPDHNVLVNGFDMEPGAEV